MGDIAKEIWIDYAKFGEAMYVWKVLRKNDLTLLRPLLGCWKLVQKENDISLIYQDTYTSFWTILIIISNGKQNFKAPAWSAFA